MAGIHWIAAAAEAKKSGTGSKKALTKTAAPVKKTARKTTKRRAK